ncbi:MAG: hypothetical protein QGI60_04110 [archaeon]|jgi:hypothetical protein|nr:hypothetical protein [archaeon]
MAGKEIKSLGDIGRKQWKELAAKVRTAQGKVIVLVHPFQYTEPGMGKFEAGVVNTLRQRKAPVVILEAQERIKETQERLRALGVSGHLIIPTSAKDPRIILKTAFLRRMAHYDKVVDPGLIEHIKKDGIKKVFTRLIGQKPVYEKHGNPALIKILRRAGAKKVWLGGVVAKADLSVNEKVRAYERAWLPKTREPSKKTISHGCIGLTYKSLIGAKGFTHVRIMPTMSYPDKPHYPLKRHRK